MVTRKQHTENKNKKLNAFLERNKVKDNYCLKFHYWENTFILYKKCKGGQSDQIFMLYQIDSGKNLQSIYKRNLTKFIN